MPIRSEDKKGMAASSSLAKTKPRVLRASSTAAPEVNGDTSNMVPVNMPASVTPSISVADSTISEVNMVSMNRRSKNVFLL